MYLRLAWFAVQSAFGKDSLLTSTAFPSYLIRSSCRQLAADRVSHLSNAVNWTFKSRHWSDHGGIRELIRIGAGQNYAV